MFIGAFGLRDPLRPNVLGCVNYARDQAELNVRLVSGDHIDTARAVARKAGILRDEDLEGEPLKSKWAVMDAAAFADEVGEVCFVDDGKQVVGGEWHGAGGDEDKDE